MDAIVMWIGAATKPLLMVFILASALVGLLAFVSPRAFAVVTARGNRWVDTWRFFRPVDNSFFRRLDKWIDLDRYAIRYARLTGLAMLAGAVTLGCVLYLR